MMWEKKTVQLLEWVPQAVKSAFFGVLAALLLGISLFNPALAEGGFSWQGETLTYNNRHFTKQTVQGETGKTFYVAKDDGKAHTLIFSGDAKQAKQATYVVYDVSADNHFTNPQNQTTVSAQSNTENSTDQTTGNSAIKAVKPEGGSSCAVEGVGWIICPIMTAVSKGLDGVQAVIAGFMDVKPINTDQNTILVKAWRTVRNISNLVFIIVFLTIIISYVTNHGVDNYNVKKTLPKLILGALMVNLSFFICALAVDLSNIVGHSIVSLFRELQAQTGTVYMEMSWAELTAAILSGGGLATAGFGAAVIATGSTTGILLALASALVSALITLVATMIILAARQALIIILIIVSPLAFVATLMPNTESYFGKWRDMMKKLLLLLPVFSVVYGGSQLAGWIIISSAQNIITILLGMIVQVIPFLILPKLVKDSDSLLGKLSDGLDKTILNPLRTGSKSMLSRYSDEARQKYLASDAARYDYAKKLTQKLDRAKRISEEKTAAYKNLASAKYTMAKAEDSSGKLFKLRIKEMEAKNLSDEASQTLSRNIENLHANLEAKIKDFNSLDDALRAIDNREEFKHYSQEVRNQLKSITRSSIYTRIKKQETEMATGMKNFSYIQALDKDISVGYYNGKFRKIVNASTGIYDSKEGSDLEILAKVSAAQRKEKEEGVKNMREMFRKYNLSDEEILELAMVEYNHPKGIKFNHYGRVEKADANGNIYKFDSNSEALVLEAAALEVIGTGNIDAINKMADQSGSGGRHNKIAPALGEMIRKAGLTKSSGSLGRQYPNLIAQGLGNKDNRLLYTLNDFKKGRFSDDYFGGVDKDYIKDIIEAFEFFKSDAINKYIKNGAFDKDAEEYKNLGFDFEVLKVDEKMKEAQISMITALTNPDIRKGMDNAKIERAETFIKMIDHSYNLDNMKFVNEYNQKRNKANTTN